MITFIYSFSSHVCDLLFSQESDARTYNATLERKDAEFNEILKVAMEKKDAEFNEILKVALEKKDAEFNEILKVALEKKDAESNEQLKAKDTAYAMLQQVTRTKLQKQQESLDDMDDELRTVKRQLEEKRGVDEIQSLKERLRISEIRRKDYVEIIKKKDAIISASISASGPGEVDRFNSLVARVQAEDRARLEATQLALDKKVAELKTVNIELKNLKVELKTLKIELKTSKDQATSEIEALKRRMEEIEKECDEQVTAYRESSINQNRIINRLSDRLLGLGCIQDHMMISRALSAPIQKKVNCFMFTFTGPRIRRYTMEYVFSSVIMGRFNDTLLYCVLRLFKGREENDLMKLIEEYNTIVEDEGAITLVPAADDLPLILTLKKYPKNVISAKQRTDIAYSHPDYQFWTNPPPQPMSACD